MLFSSLSWVILTLTLLVALPGALASPTPKRSKIASATRVTIETYPAMEDGEIAVPRQTSLPALAPSEIAQVAKTSPKSGRVQTLGAPAPVSAPISAPAAYVTVPMTPTPEKFEVVPVEKRAQIMKRMHLCERLFEATGRAYDYRTMTTAQLERELNAVEAKARPIAAAEPKPAAMNPATVINAVPTEPDPILDAQE